MSTNTSTTQDQERQLDGTCPDWCDGCTELDWDHHNDYSVRSHERTIHTARDPLGQLVTVFVVARETATKLGGGWDLHVWPAQVSVYVEQSGLPGASVNLDLPADSASLVSRGLLLAAEKVRAMNLAQLDQV